MVSSVLISVHYNLAIMKELILLLRAWHDRQADAGVVPGEDELIGAEFAAIVQLVQRPNELAGALIHIFRAVQTHMHNEQRHNVL